MSKKAERFLIAKGWDKNSPTVGGVLFQGMVELLDKYNSEMGVPRKPEWISVEDRLPEFGVEVICCWDELSGGIAIGTLNQERVINTKQGVSRFLDWDIVTSAGIADYKVTHWMPVPE